MSYTNDYCSTVTPSGIYLAVFCTPYTKVMNYTRINKNKWRWRHRWIPWRHMYHKANACERVRHRLIVYQAFCLINIEGTMYCVSCYMYTIHMDTGEQCAETPTIETVYPLKQIRGLKCFKCFGTWVPKSRIPTCSAFKLYWRIWYTFRETNQVLIWLK